MRLIAFTGSFKRGKNPTWFSGRPDPLRDAASQQRTARCMKGETARRAPRQSLGRGLRRFRETSATEPPSAAENSPIRGHKYARTVNAQQMPGRRVQRDNFRMRFGQLTLTIW